MTYEQMKAKKDAIIDGVIADEVSARLAEGRAHWCARNLAKADDSLIGACSPDETAWVIVRDLPDGLGYFDGYVFSRDNLQAIRFARKVDAERWLTLMHGPSAHSDRVEEHMWINKP